MVIAMMQETFRSLSIFICSCFNHNSVPQGKSIQIFIGNKLFLVQNGAYGENGSNFCIDHFADSYVYLRNGHQEHQCLFEIVDESQTLTVDLQLEL